MRLKEMCRSLFSLGLFLNLVGARTRGVDEWKSSIPYANALLSHDVSRVEDPRRSRHQFQKPPPENVSIGWHNSIWIMNERPLCKFRPLSRALLTVLERRYFTQRAAFRSRRQPHSLTTSITWSNSFLCEQRT